MVYATEIWQLLLFIKYQLIQEVSLFYYGWSYVYNLFYSALPSPTTFLRSMPGTIQCTKDTEMNTTLNQMWIMFCVLIKEYLIENVQSSKQVFCF